LHGCSPLCRLYSLFAQDYDKKEKVPDVTFMLRNGALGERLVHDIMDSNLSASRFGDRAPQSLVPRYGISPNLWEAEEASPHISGWGLVTALGLSTLCWMAMLKLAWIVAG
jgi:hypothetical protein